MTSDKFLIVGAGNLGISQACHLSINGYDVCLYNRENEVFNKLKEINEQSRDAFVLTGVESGRVSLSVLTSDLEFALKDRNVVMICTAANGHAAIVKCMIPYLKPGFHQIILHPSGVLGALEVHQLLVKNGFGRSDIPVSELESSLLTCRKSIEKSDATDEANTYREYIKVNIYAIKGHLGFATLPASCTDKCMAPLLPLYSDYLIRYDNVLETSLLNTNFVAHPIITLFNLTRYEREESFLFYIEGVTPHVAKIMLKVDEERLKISKALGLKAACITDKQWMELHYAKQIANKSDYHSTIVTNQAYSDIYSSNQLYSRYIWEDIPYGIMPTISLGKLVGVPTPILTSIYQMCVGLFDDTHEQDGRVLEHMGISSLQELRNIINGTQST